MNPIRPYEHVFHQSWLSTHFECPEQSRLILRGEYPPDQSEAAAKGTAVHAAIQAVIDDLVTFDMALGVGLDTFREISQMDGFRYVKVKTQSTCEAHIEGGLWSWWDYVYPTLPATKWCEEQFKFVFHEDDERVIWLAGTADYADVDGLKDWKLTSNTDKYGRDAWKLKRFDVQPTVYAAAARHLGLYGPHDDVPFQWVALNPLGRKPQFVDAVRTYGSEVWLREQLITIAEQIERGTTSRWVLRDQSALCAPDWCMAWDSCKGKFLAAAEAGDMSHPA